ncbi:MAG TPA: hypothetical protein VMW24_27170, partial [Sedimentisphaerales bacterium]|nr:hypothetical protein [Sedimentisphaerales bacterium]
RNSRKEYSEAYSTYAALLELRVLWRLGPFWLHPTGALPLAQQRREPPLSSPLPQGHTRSILELLSLKLLLSLVLPSKIQ